MTIDIPADIARRLEELAERDNLEIDDLLRDMLERYPDNGESDQKQWATLADLARNAKEANLASLGPVDTAERSREILNTEFADYLKSRIEP